MRLKLGFDDLLLIVAVFALFYFRNWQAAAFLIVVVAYAAAHYYRAKKNEPPADTNEFLIEDNDETHFTAELDVGLDYRPRPNYFRTDYRFDTHQTKCLYEYRLEQTDVRCRLIEDKHSDIGVPEYGDVRDGVVLESEIRKRDAESRLTLTKVDDRIAELDSDIQWHKMASISWHGLKYFIISKKLPQADARRCLRQELERLKAGNMRFSEEAAKCGIERDESSPGRLKFLEENPKPSDEEIQTLLDKTESFGLTRAEFSWGKKLIGVLEKLLRD